MSGPIRMQCRSCSHYDTTATVHRCAAFPDRIPDIILVNQHDHRTPYAGDGGVRFEAKPGVAESDLVALYNVLDNQGRFVSPANDSIALADALDAVDRITKGSGN